MSDQQQTELEHVQRERDLYRRLLELGGQDELEPFLESALRLVVEMTDRECFLFASAFAQYLLENSDTYTIAIAGDHPVHGGPAQERRHHARKQQGEHEYDHEDDSGFASLSHRQCARTPGRLP